MAYLPNYTQLLPTNVVKRCGVHFARRSLILSWVNRSRLTLTAWVILVLFANLPGFGAAPRNIVPSAETPEVRTLSQNWSDADADWFYSVPQGSKFIPYVWFLHLELAESDRRLLDTDNIRSLGYLPRTRDAVNNPDGLPVGFTRDGDHLGLTCAACHTSQINFRGMGWLIDGGPTLGDVSQLQQQTVESLQKTLSSDAKFGRFAARVLGSNASNATKKDDLKREMKRVLEIRTGYNQRNLPPASATHFGPGRVDAFGAILNEVTTQIAAESSNVHAADAPVSYPFLWDTPQHDRVQWNGAAKNTKLPLLAPLLGTEHIGALGRNAGEVLGVFGSADANTQEHLIPRGYSSTVKTLNLVQVEERIRKLWSPPWPAELGAIDEPRRRAGEVLFSKHCAECHASIQRDDQQRQVTAILRAVDTDQLMASNFATRTAKPGTFAGRLVKIPGIDIFSRNAPTPVGDFLVHAVQRVLVDAIPDRPFFPSVAPRFVGYDLNNLIAAEVTIDGTKLSATFRNLNIVDDTMTGGTILLRERPSDLRIIDGAQEIQLDQHSLEDKLHRLHSIVKELALDKLVKPDLEFTETGEVLIHLKTLKPASVVFAYKARPLNGIWATAPYLHNGSVPSLDELLKPARDRVKRFRMGSREFDPILVGYRTDLGDFEFDVSLRGNSNVGHEYGDTVFTSDERRQIVEYMKSL